MPYPWHSFRGSNPSAEKQLVYSTAPADCATLERILVCSSCICLYDQVLIFCTIPSRSFPHSDMPRLEFLISLPYVYHQFLLLCNNIFPGEWDALIPLWFFDTNGSPNLGQTNRPYNNQLKKKENLLNCGFCYPGWLQNKIERKQKER